MFPIAALIGSAVVGAAGSALSASSSARGAGKAADASVQATREQIAAQERATERAIAAAKSGNRTAQNALISGANRSSAAEIGGLRGMRDAQLGATDTAKNILLGSSRDAQGQQEAGIRGEAGAVIASALKNNKFFQDIFKQQSDQLSAWRDAGQNAIRYLDSGVQSGRFSMDDFRMQDDPGFQFRQEQGERALNRSHAAQGSLMSGGAVADAMRFNQGLASQEYGAAWARENQNRQQQFGNLLSLSNVGQNAANQTNTYRDTMAQRVGAGNLLASEARANQAAQLGQTGAQYTLARGQIGAGAAENRGNILSQYQAGRGSVLAQRNTAQAQARAQSALNVAGAAQQGQMNLGNQMAAAYGQQGNLLANAALQRGAAGAAGWQGVAQSAQQGGQNYLLWNMLNQKQGSTPGSGGLW